jgi:hypothetical protein
MASSLLHPNPQPHHRRHCHPSFLATKQHPFPLPHPSCAATPALASTHNPQTTPFRSAGASSSRHSYELPTWLMFTPLSSSSSSSGSEPPPLPQGKGKVPQVVSSQAQATPTCHPSSKPPSSFMAVAHRAPTEQTWHYRRPDVRARVANAPSSGCR